ncbi:hypothetical protein [Paenibacillus hexagrammi]|uniref:Uncharacterized protein n=1 Tax=Paenibacillus hexagrammi TaxID=2908839 RepID=A0ABY3SLJ2_9BACL|nr:hypothetical protein [Paenibacillus sp. YPD9-1]UJF34348.1 hypothetical protein L0M14_03820 [Paenibacillus sp. YPD9-1]
MVHIRFQNIHIDSIQDSSSVNKGDNRIVGRKHHSKSNDGFGEISGKNNQAAANSHVVIDRDRVDTPQHNRKG